MSRPPQAGPGPAPLDIARPLRPAGASAGATDAPRRAPALRAARLPAPWRALAILALAAAGGAVLYLLRPGALTDDSYAFLDWGRDLRHGILPLLERRTFHPLPVLAGSAISLLGSAAPTAAVLLGEAALVLLALAAWRVVELLGFRQPAPLLAAMLAISSPLLSLLAQVGYVNLPFATLLMCALACELEDRRWGAWAFLIVAGLVRPEGWAFLVAYGALSWWRAGRPRAPSRLLALAALSLAPMAIWLALEWQLFGTPLYSFTNTRAPAVEATGSGSLSGLWRQLQFAIVIPVLIAAGVGIVAVVRFVPPRRAVPVLGMTLVAVLTLAVLASSKFNVPSRHFSVLASLAYVLAGTAAGVPARLIGRIRSLPPPAPLAVGLCGAALVASFAVAPTVRLLRRNHKTVSLSYEQHKTLDQALTRALRFVDVRPAVRHSVALVGVVDDSETVWSLHVPYDAVSGEVGARTRLIVEPSPKAYSKLGKLGLNSARPHVVPRPGWHRGLITRDWDIWIPDGPQPVQLGPPTAR